MQAPCLCEATRKAIADAMRPQTVPEDVMQAWRESPTCLAKVLAYCKQVDHDKCNCYGYVLIGRTLYFSHEERTRVIPTTTTYPLWSVSKFEVVEAVRVEPAPTSPDIVMRYFDSNMRGYNDVVIGHFENNIGVLSTPVNVLNMLGSPVLVLDNDDYEVYLTVGYFTDQVRSCVQNIIRDTNFCFKQGDRCVTYYVN